MAEWRHYDSHSYVFGYSCCVEHGNDPSQSEFDIALDQRRKQARLGWKSGLPFEQSTSCGVDELQAKSSMKEKWPRRSAALTGSEESSLQVAVSGPSSDISSFTGSRETPPLLLLLAAAALSSSCRRCSFFFFLLRILLLLLAAAIAAGGEEVGACDGDPLLPPA
ncbi:hypothetical protein Dsin_020602 [Dipteronia sinensis]|uniref:Uncharacterized protein n=1 Tax=Dipteronia sinensis TaxID=43782 RepID=A0AAE0A9J3_9ROSI|nr:hypothetical protein Dsin_020602 [Dipteronia sinensis]